MIDPKEILALFDEPHKNQGLILHYAYQAMPELAHRVIELEGQVDPYWMNRAHELETEVIRLREILNDIYSLIAGRVIQLRDGGEIQAMGQWNDAAKKVHQALGAEGGGE